MESIQLLLDPVVAAAVAAAIASGMGGRDLTAHQLESWSAKLSKATDRSLVNGPEADRGSQ